MTHGFFPPRRVSFACAVLLVFGAPAAAQQKSVKPGANAGFVNPEMEVDQWKNRFEAESREVFHERPAVLEALNIQPGARVADVGAGTGIYAFPFAEAVGPTGRVYAIDLSPRFIEHLTKQAKERGLSQLRPMMGQERSVGLPAGSVDMLFTCDTYHHFEFPVDVLASIHRALKPGGTFVVIDFERIPGESRDWALDHVRAGQAEVRSEVEAAGFEFLDEVEIAGFKETYFLRFRRP